jgi:hypothetical protein
MQRSQPSDELGATLAPGAAAGTNLATTVAPHSAAAPSREPAIGLTLPAFSPPNPTPVPPSATERTTLREPEAARISGLDKTQISRPGAAVSVALDETHIGPPHPARIGRFTVVREPRRAAAPGVVYAAYDEQLERKIAVKLAPRRQPATRTPSAANA